MNTTRKIVISRYNEPIDWILDLECDYIIYNKGESIGNPNIPSEKIINVPNEGREAETFLRYIVSNYNDLPETIAFVQGNPFDHYPETLVTLSSKDHKGISKMGPQTSCDGNGYPSYPGLPLSHIQKIAMPDLDIDNFYFTAGAQMMVDKEYILNKPLEWWESVFSMYNSYWFSNIESGYGHKPGVFIAHVFERLWEYIFKYDIKK
jgi:hypothetical protein